MNIYSLFKNPIYRINIFTMENDNTLAILVENIFSRNRPQQTNDMQLKQTNDMQPTCADWAVINKTIYSELRLRVNGTVFYTFPYLGRSIMNAISKKLIQKATEFENKGGERSLTDQQINQIVNSIVDSILNFVENLGRGLHSPKM